MVFTSLITHLKKKKQLKAFKYIVTIFKVDSFKSSFLFLYKGFYDLLWIINFMCYYSSVFN